MDSNDGARPRAMNRTVGLSHNRFAHAAMRRPIALSIVDPAPLQSAAAASLAGLASARSGQKLAQERLGVVAGGRAGHE